MVDTNDIDAALDTFNTDDAKIVYLCGVMDKAQDKAKVYKGTTDGSFEAALHGNAYYYAKGVIAGLQGGDND